MIRNTHQKETVIATLKTMRGMHPTAEEVYAEVVQSIPSISRATVYRILKQASETGAIAQLHTPQSADRYDDQMRPHCHMLCTSCKRVVDIYTAPPQKITLPEGDLSGCNITGAEFIYTGTCPDCRNK